jgi:hypothetical protein
VLVLYRGEAQEIVEFYFTAEEWQASGRRVSSTYGLGPLRAHRDLADRGHVRVEGLTPEPCRRQSDDRVI